MHHDQPCILILEDDKFTSKLIYSALSQNFADACLIPAYDIDQARILCQHLDVDLILCDVYLPDGHGMDFVFNLMMTNPLLQVIVISSAHQPEVIKRTQEWGTVHFVPKPVEIDPLLDYVRQALTKVSLPERKAPQFKARLSALTPLDLVQMKCLSNASEVLEFHTGSGLSGQLYFRDGHIVHAEAGGILGEEAFNRILSWEAGEIKEQGLPDNFPVSIHQDWQSLLMNAAHALDTQNAGLAAPAPAPAPALPAGAEVLLPTDEPPTASPETAEVVGGDFDASVAQAAVLEAPAPPPLMETAPAAVPEAPLPTTAPDPTQTQPSSLALDELLITNSRGGVRASFGLDTTQAHQYAARLAEMRPQVQHVLGAMGLGTLDKLEFANTTRGAVVQLDPHGGVLALGLAEDLPSKRLLKNAIFMMEQIL
ncbi:MAG: DUF4388 domain-containing protein [Verrucomicrobiota bacterium]